MWSYSYTTDTNSFVKHSSRGWFNIRLTEVSGGSQSNDAVLVDTNETGESMATALMANMWALVILLWIMN